MHGYLLTSIWPLVYYVSLYQSTILILNDDCSLSWLKSDSWFLSSVFFLRLLWNIQSFAFPLQILKIIVLVHENVAVSSRITLICKTASGGLLFIFISLDFFDMTCYILSLYWYIFDCSSKVYGFLYGLRFFSEYIPKYFNLFF